MPPASRHPASCGGTPRSTGSWPTAHGTQRHSVMAPPWSRRCVSATDAREVHTWNLQHIDHSRCLLHLDIPHRAERTAYTMPEARVPGGVLRNDVFPSPFACGQPARAHTRSVEVSSTSGHDERRPTTWAQLNHAERDGAAVSRNRGPRRSALSEVGTKASLTWTPEGESRSEAGQDPLVGGHARPPSSGYWSSRWSPEPAGRRGRAESRSEAKKSTRRWVNCTGARL